MSHPDEDKFKVIIAIVVPAGIAASGQPVMDPQGMACDAAQTLVREFKRRGWPMDLDA